MLDYTKEGIESYYMYVTIYGNKFDMNFEQGSILLAKDRRLRAGYHPIVYLEPNNTDDFIGAMLTHSTKYGNIKLDSNFFHCKKGFEKSYIVPKSFIKFKKWGPFLKVNQLTPEGLELILKQIKGSPELFSSYYAKIQNNR